MELHLNQTQNSVEQYFVAGLILLTLMVSPLLAAPQDETSTEPKADVAEKKARSEVSDADRDAAMKFAADNHPELARLLEQLQKSRPHEFSRAIKELNQQVQLLERVREKNAAKYQGQLEAWRKASQIRVLMARWSRSKDVELEKQVRELLRTRREAKLAQLKADKERIAEQQRKIDEQLAAMAVPIESQVDREWEQLSKKAGSKTNSDAKKSDTSAATDGVKK